MCRGHAHMSACDSRRCGTVTPHGARAEVHVGPGGKTLLACILMDGSQDQAKHGKETRRMLA